MSECKWTPGPWAVDIHGGYAHGPRDTNDSPVVSWAGMAKPRQTEGHANAQLIAASPLLFLSLANRALLCDSDFDEILVAVKDQDNEKLRELWERIQAKELEI